MCHRKDKMEQEVIHMSIYNVVVGGNDKNGHQVRGAYFLRYHSSLVFIKYGRLWGKHQYLVSPFDKEN